MKIIVTANITPFMYGGADYHISGVTEQLRRHGHEVELIRFPFRFSPESAVNDLMEYCEKVDLEMPNGISVDRVISLQFPGYGVRHPNHVVWVMHQHRAVYDLYNMNPKSEQLIQLKKNIESFDFRALSGAKHLFANSLRVAERLTTYNNLKATPLYHPPRFLDSYYCKPAQPYIFYPSRLESLKRQELLIRSATYLKTSTKILIAGDGGQYTHYQMLIEELGVGEKVRLLGHVSNEEKMSLYANCLAVFFGPLDEDYGYVTLEAMLSEKPVISCTDSGGPLEFVMNNESGYVIEPSAEILANTIDELYANPGRSSEMGKCGRQLYEKSDISWDNVVSNLLKP